eukprot:CAMPEP_0171075868 /NCGR_PEP_ID=MMETSP0766_2-20121228/13042_1 /TAXON_ID=439317 /ORGANISM="Gambierdiscus australes, Strain CAWD 149" /LENGTH=420 /DNA_ID=CAMNT_0011532773 /DNA_START=39 /DNA_END=1301 /DNA_ORIENTATION=-
MGKPTKEPSPWQKRARKKVKVWTAFMLRVVIYLFLATLANIRSMWSWTSEPRGFLCDNPPRGAKFNQTKVKALVYALAKTGTTSTAHLLHSIIGKTWHSEEFLLHVWAPLNDKFWLKEENGGSVWAWGRLATPAAPAYKGHSFWQRTEHASDLIAQRGMDFSEIAGAIEKCHVNGLTFDGLENLFWPIYEASPEAKVIMLNWRDFNAFYKSGSNFALEVFVGLLALNFLNCGQHYLPWNAWAIPLLDSFLGHVTQLMRTGDRMMDWDSLLILLFRQSVTERRFCQHWHSGHGFYVRNESTYNGYWEYAKKIIPKERLIELNLKKHTPADVCKMLGVKDKPVCKDTGKIPNIYPLLNMETERWWWMALATPWFLFIHWVNHNLTWGAIYWVAGTLSALFWGCAGLLGVADSMKGGKKAKKA